MRLAINESDVPLEATGFSQAGDIVELVVLTQDTTTLQTLREAVSGSRRLWHVTAAEKIGDLLVAGEVGIVVLDAAELGASSPRFIGEITRQFPELVVLVTGNRDSETALAGLISGGTVYRFIHKPLSPARARLFVDAAVRRFGEQRRRPPQPAAVPARPLKRPAIGAGLGAVVLAVILTTVTAAFLARSYLSGGRTDAARVAPAAATLVAVPAAAVPDAATAREQLLSKAENALLEERLDEAAAAIDAARRAGAQGGRVDFLSAQLAKSRERLALSQARARADNASHVPAAGPKDAGRTQAALAERLLAEARAALDRREFDRADTLLDTATGVATPPEIDAVRQQLNGARHEAESESRQRLLKLAAERVQQDQLIEPENDSAKHYLATLRGIDPAFPGLQTALQDLGARLVAKARGALTLGQSTAARGWLDQAGAIGYSSGDAAQVQRDLDAAANRRFMADVAPANSLTLTKSVPLQYPEKAQRTKTEGWVELDFTVADTGDVRDIAVHGASPVGEFEQAAIDTLTQWRYRPVIRDSKPVPQRARIRIRFSLIS